MDIPIKNPDSQQENLSLLVYILLMIFIIPVPYIRHIAALIASMLPGRAMYNTSIVGTFAQVILLSLPLIPLTLFWPNPRYRVIFRTWLYANCLSLVSLPVYLIKPIADHTIVLLHIGLFCAFYVAINYLANKRTRRGENSFNNAEGPALHSSIPPNSQIPSLWLTTFLMISISSLPWLARGSLGSLFDTILQLLFGLVFGVTSIILLEKWIFLPTHQSNVSPWSSFFLVGSASVITLLLMASATTFPYGGIQILLMLVLPGLGWSFAALELLTSKIPNSSKWLSLSFLVGLIASAPMVMIDPDELILILNLSAGEILWIAIQAALISMLIISCFDIIFFLALFLDKRMRSSPRSIRLLSKAMLPFLGISLLVSFILMGFIYLNFGKPGFYGENLFVILKDQADVSTAPNITDYHQRRQFVYQTLVRHANKTQNDLRNTMDRFGIPYQSYYLVNGLMVPNNPLLYIWLLSRPEIDRILDNPQLRPLPEHTLTRSGRKGAPEQTPWNLTMIEADRVWKDFGVKGEGIIIGQSDSGVQGDHPELIDSYRGNNYQDDFNWFDPWYHSTSPNDYIGHGTHTLGSILGEKTGVAPGATWIACVNLARNLGNPAFYLDCMQFMLAPFPQDGDPLKDGNPHLGAHVLNNSWGCPAIEGCDPNTFLSAVRALRAAGIFFVAGAGNDGPSCGSLNVPPPIYQEVFAVGAVNKDGNLAIFSSIGPVTSDGSERIKPDVLAPGVDILSSLPGSTYDYQSGTSMAGPHVVGVVALMWSANPNLIGDIELTEQILRSTAKSYTGYLPNCPGADNLPSTAVGYGIVDAYAAVKKALGR